MARDKNLRIRRNTAANAASSNPVLDAGEVGYETDTKRLKVGDGATAWTSLPEVGTGTYVPMWLPSTAYTVGQRVLSPAGDVVIATTAHTSGAVFDAGKFTSTRAGRDRRATAARFDASTMTLARLISSGLTLSGGVISASVGGTDGVACLPIFTPAKNFRASARITATKATASSKSNLGFTVAPAGTLPNGSEWGFGVGYLQGTGLVLFRENFGSNTTILADASITDGTQYDVSVFVETTMSTAGGAYGSINYRIRTTAGVDLYQGATTFSAPFAPGSITLRTNVAAGADRKSVV